MSYHRPTPNFGEFPRPPTPTELAVDLTPKWLLPYAPHQVQEAAAARAAAQAGGGGGVPARLPPPPSESLPVWLLPVGLGLAGLVGYKVWKMKKGAAP